MRTAYGPRLPLLLLVVSFAFAGCASSSVSNKAAVVANPSGIVVLTPMGTADKPVSRYILGPTTTFTLAASEEGYAGTFTAQNVTPGMTSNSCWVAPPQSSTGIFLLTPGSVCEVATGASGFTEQIKVSDANGNAATTFVYGRWVDSSN